MKTNPRKSWLTLACVLATVGCRARGLDEAAGSGTGGEGDGSETGSDTGEDDGVAADCQDRLPAQRIRRLSHAEYRATLASLFGAASLPPMQMAADNVVSGYDNDAEALTVSGLLADQYRVTAEAVADVVTPDAIAALSCTQGAVDCAEQFVRDFGSTVFRRPMSDQEVERYVAAYVEFSAEDSWQESLRWIVAGMLQSPHFLYRTEVGVEQPDGTFQLTPYETASSIAYLVTGTSPDAELLAAAADGSLAEVEVRVAHAERLLATSGAARTQLAFSDRWLQLGLLEQVSRDAELFPDFTTTVRAAMRGEVERLITDVFVGGGTLSDLLLADYTFVNSDLAAFYGQPMPDGDPDGEGFVRVQAPGDPGVLARGALMATHALPQSPSPIHRGVLVRERVLCNELPPPPPGVANGIPEVDPKSSNRARYLLHSADPACAGCHVLIDSIGFGFEHYDAVGRWQDMDRTHEIDASGEVAGIADSAFDGAGELAAVLANNPQVTECYAEQWSTFALGGIAHDDGLACVAADVVQRFVDHDGRLDSVIVGLVESPGFVLRRDSDATGPGEPDPDSGDGASVDDEGGSTGGDTGAAPGDPGVEVVVVQQSNWPTGECNDVTVTNVSDQTVTWSIELPILGTVTTAWNCTYEMQDGTASFSGVDFNGTLEPGWSGTFGYCSDTV